MMKEIRISLFIKAPERKSRNPKTSKIVKSVCRNQESRKNSGSHMTFYSQEES